MADNRTRKQCDRCGVRPATGKLFRIPWTGDRLCKDCIDKDSNLQQMFAEIDSMAYDRRLRDLGIPPISPTGWTCPYTSLSRMTSKQPHLLRMTVAAFFCRA